MEILRAVPWPFSDATGAFGAEIGDDAAFGRGDCVSSPRGDAMQCVAVDDVSLPGFGMDFDAFAGLEDVAAGGVVGLGHVNLWPISFGMAAQGVDQSGAHEVVRAFPDHHRACIGAGTVQRQAKHKGVRFADHPTTVWAGGQQAIDMGGVG